jgi:hypothetical protein
VDFAVDATNDAFGTVWFGTDPGVFVKEHPVIKGGPGDSAEVVIKTFAYAEQPFHVVEEAAAAPLCHGDCGPPRDTSAVVVDPGVSFDQAAFDDLAAQCGMPTVQLDQVAKIEFSAGLDQLPSLPDTDAAIFADFPSLRGRHGDSAPLSTLTPTVQPIPDSWIQQVVANCRAAQATE